MGRIFIGIVKCGAWGCFDEFNRLEEVVLSAVSTQIQAIQTAIRNKSPSCDLLDRKVKTYTYTLIINQTVVHVHVHCVYTLVWCVVVHLYMLINFERKLI